MVAKSDGDGQRVGGRQSKPFPSTHPQPAPGLSAVRPPELKSQVTPAHTKHPGWYIQVGMLIRGSGGGGAHREVDNPRPDLVV